MDLLSVALVYRAAGLGVLPANRSRKCPRLSGWKQFHDRIPTVEELNQWSPFDAICLVCGPTSGYLELIDFDGQGELYPAWRQAVEAINPDLLGRVVIERSPSGGFHVVYRCPDGVEGNQKLAQRAIQGLPNSDLVALYGKDYRPLKQPDGTFQVVLTLIETRGAGGLFLCAPTPGYQFIQGSLEEIPTVTAGERAALLQAARSLNEWHQEASQTRPHLAPDRSTGEKPGEAYNARGDVTALLQRHDWTQVGSNGDNEQWRRPGKSRGISATWHTEKRVFYCFSSSAGLPADRGLSAFQLYTLLEHGGDHSAAASALRQQGYGEQWDPCQGVDLSGIMGHPEIVADEPKEEEESLPDLPDPGTLPAELLEVPGFIGDVMRYNLDNAINPIPELALAGALCLQAVLVGRKVRDELDNRTNLYVIGTAGSGAGKNFARTVNRGLLYEAGAGALEGPEDIASDSGLLNTVQGNPSILFQIDEVGRFLKTLSAKDSPHLAGIMTMLMRLFSSANTVYKGKAYADTAKVKEIQYPNVVVYGTGVPEEFYAAMAHTALVNGSMARLMIFEGSGQEKLRRCKLQPFPIELLTAVRDMHQWTPGDPIASMFGNALLVESTPGASERMAAFRDHCYTKTRGADEVSCAIWARCGEKAHKLSLIYACSKLLLDHIHHGVPLVIDQEAAEWACKLARWNTERMLFLAGRWVSSTQFEDQQKKLIRFAASKGGRITRREVMRKFGLDSKDTDRLLKGMHEAGRLIEDKTGRSNQVAFKLP